MCKWSSTWALACTETTGYQGILSYSIIYSAIKLIAVPNGGGNLCQTPERKRLRGIWELKIAQRYKNTPPWCSPALQRQGPQLICILQRPMAAMPHQSTLQSQKAVTQDHIIMTNPDLAQEPTRLSCVYCMTQAYDHQPERRSASASAAGGGSGRNGCTAGGLALPGAGCARAGCATAADATSIARV